MPVFEILNHNGGISDFNDRGVRGSFQMGKNLDIRKKRDTLSANQALKDIGVTIDSPSPSISPSASESPSSSISRSPSASVSPSSSESPSGTAAPFAIGADFDGTGAARNFFDGIIDEVRVWSDIRTPEEILDNYNKELVGNEAGLVGYWKLNNNYLDETSNNNDLSPAGSPTFVTDVPFVSSAIKQVAGIDYALVKKVSNVAIASVKKISGVE